jgi:hypothetical protein
MDRTRIFEEGVLPPSSNMGSMVGHRITLLLALALASCGKSAGSAGEPELGGAGAGGLAKGGAGVATSGSSGNGGASSGNGGASSGNGGASAGASGASAGSSGLGQSQAEACMAYVGAVCNRQEECSGNTSSNPYPCSSACPDVEFAPGSTRTVEGLFACAEQYKSLPCAQVQNGPLPPCAAPGTKQGGEPCVFNAQCASLACKITGTCGSCARVVPENGDCTAADAACGLGLSCVGGVCVVLGGNVKQPGEACTNYTECDQANAFCNPSGVCAVYPGEDQNCAASNHCTSAFYCASADQICRARPTLDQPCGNDAASNIPACASGLACTAAVSPSPGTCIGPVVADVGGDCSSASSRCVIGATCTCTSAACAEKRCTLPRLVGESCGDALDQCNPALDCVAGFCVPAAYRGTFEKACGP